MTTAAALDLGSACYRASTERDINRVLAIADITRELLSALGEDPLRDGLADTPIRVGYMWRELLSGANTVPEDVLQTRGGDVGFENPGYDEMVILEGIEFVSMCEHHLMPFFGTVSIAYIPNKQVVGVSKLARLTEVFARRLQIQERMTKEIADTLWEALQPKGVAVIVQATHMCMVARGVKKRATMTTNVMRGVFREDPRARAELLASLKE